MVVTGFGEKGRTSETRRFQRCDPWDAPLDDAARVTARLNALE